MRLAELAHKAAHGNGLLEGLLKGRSEERHTSSVDVSGWELFTRGISAPHPCTSYHEGQALNGAGGGACGGQVRSLISGGQWEFPSVYVGKKQLSESRDP